MPSWRVTNGHKSKIQQTVRIKQHNQSRIIHIAIWSPHNTEKKKRAKDWILRRGGAKKKKKKLNSARLNWSCKQTLNMEGQRKTLPCSLKQRTQIKQSDHPWQVSYHRTCTKKHAFWKYLKPLHDKVQAFHRFWQLTVCKFVKIHPWGL